jgi:transcriptional regulator with XRE-family HTH domain
MGRLRPAHIDDAAAVGARIHAARARSGLSLREIAFPGCSPSFLSRVEQGERVPSPATLERLARQLGVSADELAGIPAGRRIPSWRVDMAEGAAHIGARGAAAELRRLLADAQRLEDDHAASRALEGLGRLALASGNSSALGLLERARATEPEVGARERPHLFRALMQAYAERGRSEDATAVAADAFREVSADPADPQLVVSFGRELAERLGEAGRDDQQRSVLAQVRMAERTIADPKLAADTDLALARSFGSRGAPRVAEAYARRLLAQIEAAGHEDGPALAGGAVA